LAKKWGIENYPTPAGGCLLTDPQYALRLSKLIAAGMVDRRAIARIRQGRFFQISQKAFLSVGRDEEMNAKLELLADADTTLFIPAIGKGPSAITLGDFSQEELGVAAAIVGRRIKGDETRAVKVTSNGATTIVLSSPISEDVYARMMVV
jgi:hypothetical protein